MATIQDHIDGLKATGNYDQDYLSQLKSSLEQIKKSQKMFKNKLKNPKVKFVSLIVGQLTNPKTGEFLKISDVYRNRADGFINSRLNERITTIQNLINGHEKILSLMDKLSDKKENGSTNLISGKVEERNPFIKDQEYSDDSEDVDELRRSHSDLESEQVDVDFFLKDKEDTEEDQTKDIQKMMTIEGRKIMKDVPRITPGIKCCHDLVNSICDIVEISFQDFFEDYENLTDKHERMERLRTYLTPLRKCVQKIDHRLTSDHCKFTNYFQDNDKWEEIKKEITKLSSNNDNVEKNENLNNLKKMCDNIQDFNKSLLNQTDQFTRNKKNITKKIKNISLNHKSKFEDSVDKLSDIEEESIGAFTIDDDSLEIESLEEEKIVSPEVIVRTKNEFSKQLSTIMRGIIDIYSSTEAELIIEKNPNMLNRLEFSEEIESSIQLTIPKILNISRLNIDPTKFIAHIYKSSNPKEIIVKSAIVSVIVSQIREAQMALTSSIPKYIPTGTQKFYTGETIKKIFEFKHMKKMIIAGKDVYYFKKRPKKRKRTGHDWMKKMLGI